MARESLRAARRAAVFAVAVLLCLPVAGFAQTGRGGMMRGAHGSQSYGNYVTGTVQSVNRDLNYLTVRDQSGRDVKVDVRSMDTQQSINVWQLRAGDRVAANGGWENRDTFQARTVSYSTYRPMTSASAAVDPNALFGTVVKVNRKLNFVTVRDQDSGRNVKIDVRRMDTRQSVGVWDLRAGDPIVVNGSWTNNNTFQANRIGVSNLQPMTSSYGASNANFVSGVVQNVNRDLNYVTLRDDATGAAVKIDVRRMDTRRSVNVWQLRAGDRIATSGTWTDRETFQADTVNF